jgi:hypothetical protein
VSVVFDACPLSAPKINLHHPRARTVISAGGLPLAAILFKQLLRIAPAWLFTFWHGETLEKVKRIANCFFDWSKSRFWSEYLIDLTVF